ncbi:MAG: type II secretion system protein GspM [Pseudomonadota bacterium]
MQLLPDRENNKPLAIGLLVIAAMVVYLGGVHWFVNRHLELSQDIEALETSVARFKAAVARRPDLEQRLSELRSERLDNALFLQQSNFNTAAASLVRRLRESIAEQAEDPELCSVSATQNRIDSEPERFEQVTVNVRMSCPLPDMVRILYALEDNVPLIFVDNLIINQRMSADRRSRRVGVDAYGQLDVRFDMYGFLAGQVGS